jgi:hypothetical protein
MRQRTGLRDQLTYSNVMSTLCFFLLLSGGVAYAAGHLGKNSVGTKQLKRNSVTAAKLRKNSVGTVKIKDGAVNGSKVQDGSLTGTDIDQDSLNKVRAANVTAISITEDGNCTPSLPPPSGMTSERLGTGLCKLTLPNPVTQCAATATIHYRGLGPVILSAAERAAQVVDRASEPKALEIRTFENGNLENMPFDLVLVC